MATSIGSGLGGFAAIAPQPAYGATFVTPTRVLNFKTCKTTYEPHIVQGGPYLAGGNTVAYGSAHVSTWQDAKATLTGDVTDSGHALLFKQALASSAALSAIGTTTAYELGGASGANLGVADTNGSYIDLQLGVPTTDGTQNPQSYHSGVITKAEWVFDRSGLVTYSYDLDFQYVETTTALITPTYPTSQVPFSMAGATSLFQVGAFGAEVTIDGVRKVTFTLERPMALDRIYLGNPRKSNPVTNNWIKLTASIEADFTPAAKTALFDLFLAQTPISIVTKAVGGQIGTSGQYKTFGLNMPNCFIDTGGEAGLDGPDEVKNSLSLTGTLDAASDPALKGTLITADATLS